MRRWKVLTADVGMIDAPDPIKTELGWVIYWLSPASGYNRQTPPVPTMSGAVACWAAMSGHIVCEIDSPYGLGYSRCEGCKTCSPDAETQDIAHDRDRAAGWYFGDLTLCPKCRP